jgi:hypothetical protein
MTRPPRCVLVNVSTGESMPCLFNPTQLSEKLQVNWNRRVVLTRSSSEAVTSGRPRRARSRSFVYRRGTMAKAKTGARNIVVNDVKYRWRASGNDGFIQLVVWPETLPGAAILSIFDYDQTLVPNGNGRFSSTRQVVITNRIVRRVVEYALQRFSYDPQLKAGELKLGPLSAVLDLSDALRSA